MSCERSRAFHDAGEDGFVCDHCGWMQDSEAGGAAELCTCATWHSVAAYEEMRDLARSGGYTVPDAPPNFTP